MVFVALKVLLVILVMSISKGFGRPPILVTDNHINLCLKLESAAYYNTSAEFVCCSCKAGEHLVKDCEKNDPKTTQCELCIHNGTVETFTSESNSYRNCNKSKSESYCKQLMYTEFHVGSSTMDNRCLCVNGSYAIDPEANGCKTFTKCPQDFEPKFDGNSTHDVKCGPCPNGMCSFEDSSIEKCVMCSEGIINASDVPTTSAPRVTGAVVQTLNIGMVIGIAAGILGLAVMIVILVIRKFLHRQRKPKDRPNVGYEAAANDNNGTDGASSRPQPPTNGSAMPEAQQTNGATHTPQPDTVKLPESESFTKLDSSERGKGENTNSGSGVSSEQPNTPTTPKLERQQLNGNAPKSNDRPMTSPHVTTMSHQNSPVASTQNSGIKSTISGVISGQPIAQAAQEPEGQQLIGNASESISIQISSDGSTHDHESPAPTDTSSEEAMSSLDPQFQEDLDVFDNKDDKRMLRKMNMPEALHETLDSEDCLNHMCRNSYLDLRTEDLKHFMRTNNFLTENQISDINTENEKESERRWKYLEKMCENKGKKLNPKGLLQKAICFYDRTLYDNLCKSFISYLNLVNSNVDQIDSLST